MVLAAGVGSRLAPLTDATPKALVELGGTPMLEIVLRRLKAAGVTAAVVNAFHHADAVADFVASRRDLGLSLELSREEALLDTGGGLKKAAPFFDDGRPFFVHNADVLTDLDLEALYAHHLAHPALATLAAWERKASRRLLFGQDGGLVGREGDPVPPGARALGFSGVQVASPELFGKLSETGAFPILDAYLRLAREGQRIQAWSGGPCRWHDIGTLPKLEAARLAFSQGGFL